MGYTAGNLDGVTTSAMAEICRVNLQFATVRRGMVPFGANLPANHLNAGVNRRFGVLFVYSKTVGVLDLGLAPAPRDVFRLAGPGGPTV